MFADVDGDTLSDLYITMNFQESMDDLFFYNRDGKTFANEGYKRGIADFDGGSHGGCFADLDNDGDYDLFNGTTSGVNGNAAINNIFQNNGKGYFSEVSSSGIPLGAAWPTRSVLSFDMDRDGDLDLFCVSGHQGSNDPPGERNEVYRNDGNFRFTPIQDGDLVTASCGQGATDTDYDGDGDIDVITANRTGEVNILQNDGTGHFSKIAPDSIGIGHGAPDGIFMADIDNDGDLDMLLAGDNIGFLYVNKGNGRFFFQQEFSNTDGYMGGFADLDNDGDMDLVFAGDTKIYLNDGEAHFSSGLEVEVGDRKDPRAIAFSDIDNDGDLDFAIGYKRSPNALIRNNLNSGNWLKVRLVSAKGQAGAFGAKTTIYPKGEVGKQILGFRESRSNNGYLGQNDPVLHFGLGSNKFVDVVVEFLDGSRVVQTNVAAGQTVTIRGEWWKSSPIEWSPLDRTVSQWLPFLEWSVENPIFHGNPYDLIATVDFIHPESGEKRTTGMFYAGNDTWKFRFTGTLSGRWVFMTSSVDADLDGKYGSVYVAPNPGAPGFVTQFGNKWGKQGLDKAFVPQLVMYANPCEYHDNPAKIDADIKTFLLDHGFDGFHTSVHCRWFDIDQERSLDIHNNNPNPDLRTFEALELLIIKVHAAGGMVHIWAWGDEARKQTPLKWGINGRVDKRLQRYIAARLGPLPGWTMGYGFDLWEWVNGDQLSEWHNYLHSQLGWPHLLGARASKNQLNQLSESLDYSGYEQHRPDYQKYVETINSRPHKPSFSEDRFRVRFPSPYPDKDYTFEMTRRGLWQSTMAGGVANIWGYLPEGRSNELGSAPYPQSEWIKTYAVFFENRFLEDWVRDNSITNGVCLKVPGETQYVFYREDASSIAMELSGMAAPQKAVAVDTRKPYQEIDIGVLSPKDQKWNAPYPSDWAIAVGAF
jgi:hypothetical protein